MVAGLATNYVLYVSWRSRIAYFENFGRADGVLISPIVEVSLCIFLRLPDDMPKGLYERLDWGLDFGLMITSSITACEDRCRALF